MRKLYFFLFFIIGSILGCIEKHEYKSTQEGVIYIEDRFSDGKIRCVTLSNQVKTKGSFYMNFSISSVSSNIKKSLIDYGNKKFPDISYEDGQLLFCYNSKNKNDKDFKDFLFKIHPYVPIDYIQVIEIKQNERSYEVSPVCILDDQKRESMRIEFISNTNIFKSRLTKEKKRLYKPIVYINPALIDHEDYMSTECSLYSIDNNKISSFRYSTNGQGVDNIVTSYCMGTIIFDKKKENTFCLTNKKAEYLKCSQSRCDTKDPKHKIPFSLSIEQIFPKDDNSNKNINGGFLKILSVMTECEGSGISEKSTKKSKRGYDYEQYSYSNSDSSTVPPVYDNIHNKKYFCNNVMVNYQTLCDPSSKCCTDKCLFKKKGDVCSVNKLTGDIATCDGQSEGCPIQYTRFSSKQVSIKTKKFNISLFRNTTQNIGRSV